MVYNGENPIFFMDDLGVPLFWETPIYSVSYMSSIISSGSEREILTCYHKACHFQSLHEGLASKCRHLQTLEFFKLAEKTHLAQKCKVLESNTEAPAPWWLSEVTAGGGATAGGATAGKATAGGATDDGGTTASCETAVEGICRVSPDQKVLSRKIASDLSTPCDPKTWHLKKRVSSAKLLGVQLWHRLRLLLPQLHQRMGGWEKSFDKTWAFDSCSNTESFAPSCLKRSRDF